MLCDVNQLALDSASQRYPKAKTFNDLRRVFDRPNDFDAVVVSTAEHTHAFATYLALTHGKHVYCEKPLAYNIWETRLIRETAAKYPKLSTQMGNQGHASPARRTIKEILMTGVIGPVREVHVWADRAWGLQDAASAEKFDKPHGFYNGIQIVERFKEEMPVPSTQSLRSVARPRAGAAVPRDVFPRTAVVPLVGFRQRHDERPRQPRQRRAVHRCWTSRQPLHDRSDVAERAGGAPGTGARDADGDLRVRGVAGVRSRSSWCGIRATANRQAGCRRGAAARAVHRRQGHAARQRQAAARGAFKDFQTPPETLPRSPGHWVEWVNYAKGNGPVPGSNFQYSGWTTEANHLGNVAYRTGKKIEWDYQNLRATQRAGSRPVHQAARVPQRLARHPEGWRDILKADRGFAWR